MTLTVLLATNAALTRLWAAKSVAVIFRAILVWSSFVFWHNFTLFLYKNGGLMTTQFSNLPGRICAVPTLAYMVYLLCRSFESVYHKQRFQSVSWNVWQEGSKKNLRVLKELGGLRAPFGDWRREDVAQGSLMVIPGLVMPAVQLQYVTQTVMEFG
jgi:hypothetical protein